MEKVIEEIKKAEEEAKTQIAEARKAQSARLNDEKADAESRKTDIRKKGEGIIEKAIQTAQQKAQAEIDELQKKHDDQNSKMRTDVESRMNKAKDQIVEEFLKWQ